VITPVLLIVAAELVTDVHVPPDGEEDNVDVAPTQAIDDPDIEAGDAITVTVVATGEPQPFA
jgi:hypothetical protein